jgi:heme/copper-type cytochrome/quinol oxidase subunit 2
VFDLSWTTATFWVAAVACVVAQVAIVRSVLVARAPEGGALPGPAAVRRSAEVAWAVVPAVALGVVLAFTWRAL